MLRFGFGGKLKPRRFDYLPRYYDETKESLESRLSKHNDEATNEEHIKERIKIGIRRKYTVDNSYRGGEVRKSNIRLLYVFVVLIFVCYMILKSDKIVQLMNYLDS